MAEFRSARASRSDWGLFTRAELEGILQIEFERSRRHDIDLACMAIAVDRLGHLHDLYGYTSKEEIQDALVAMLKSATRDSDFPRCPYEDHLLAVFPHTPPQGAATLARRLVAGARQLRFETDGRTMQITISIGLSHSRDGMDSFAAMAQRAQAGLALARAAGGDRWLKGAQAESQIDELRSELDDLRRALEQKGRVAAEALEASRAIELQRAGGPAPPPTDEDARFAQDMRKLLGAQAAAQPELAHAAEALIERALRELREQRQGALAKHLSDHQSEVETLERRVQKLTRALGATEDELRRVAGTPTAEPGIASMYRTVQGLSLDAVEASAKLAALSKVFQANLELQKRDRSADR
jgi:diguanylate cyclase (GGDEF)-like protein